MRVPGLQLIQSKLNAFEDYSRRNIQRLRDVEVV